MDNKSRSVSQMHPNAYVLSGSTAPIQTSVSPLPLTVQDHKPKRQISLARKKHNKIRRNAYRLKLSSTRSNDGMVIKQRPTSSNDRITPVTPRDITINHSTSVATCKSYPWTDSMSSTVSTTVSPTVSRINDAADVVSRLPANTPTPTMNAMPLMEQDHQPKLLTSLAHMKPNERRTQDNWAVKYASMGSHEEKVVERQRTMWYSRVSPASTDDVTLCNSVSAAIWKSYRCPANKSSRVPPTMSKSRSQMDPHNKIVSRNPVPSMEKRSMSLSCEKSNQKWKQTEMMKTSNLTICHDRENVNQQHSSSIKRKRTESTVKVTTGHFSSVVTWKLHPGTENMSQTVPQKVSTTIPQLDSDSGVTLQTPGQSPAICRLPFSGQEHQSKRRVKPSRQKHNKRRSLEYKLRKSAFAKEPLTPMMNLLSIKVQPYQPKRSISLSCEKQNQKQKEVDAMRTLPSKKGHGREEVNQQHTSSLNRMSPKSTNEVTVGHSDSAVTWKLYPWTKFATPTVQPEVSTTVLHVDPDANVTLPFPTAANSRLPFLNEEHQQKQTVSLPHKKHSQNRREAYTAKNLASISDDRVEVDHQQTFSTEEFSLESSNHVHLDHLACMTPCKSSAITENMSAMVSPSVLPTMHPTIWPLVSKMIPKTMSQIDPRTQLVRSPAPTPTTLMRHLPTTRQDHMAKRTISLSRKKRNRRRKKVNNMKNLTVMRSKELVEVDQRSTLRIGRKSSETPVQVTKGHSSCVATSESYPWTEHMSTKYSVSQIDPHAHVIMNSPATTLTPMMGLNSFVGGQHQSKESISKFCEEYHHERGGADVMSNVTSMGSNDGVIIENQQTLCNDRVAPVAHKDVTSGHSPSNAAWKSYQETEKLSPKMWPPAMPIVSPRVWQVNPDVHVVSPSPASSTTPVLGPLHLTGQDPRSEQSICLSPKRNNKQQRQTDSDKKLISTVSKDMVELDQQHSSIIDRMSPKPPDEVNVVHSTSVATCTSYQRTENVSPMMSTSMWPPVLPVVSPKELQMVPEAHKVSRNQPPTLTTLKSQRPSKPLNSKGLDHPSKRPISLGRKKHNQRRKQTNRAKKTKWMKIKGGVIIDKQPPSSVDRMKPKSPDEVALGTLASTTTSNSYPRTDNMSPKMTATVRSATSSTVSQLDSQAHDLQGSPAHIPTPVLSLTPFLGQHHQPERSISSLSNHFNLDHSASVATCQSNQWIESVLEIVSQLDFE